MELRLFRHLWGVQESHETFFPKAKLEGYHGVESELPPPGPLRETFLALLQENELALAVIFNTEGTTPAEHLASYRKQVADLADLRPEIVVARSGRDHWSFWEARQFFRDAMDIETEYGVHVAHMTHRGRVFFNPWITCDILRDVPGVGLCCDFSHWVCVTERLLDDCAPALELCARQAVHIHARVGYEEGPQVPDPRAPEYGAQVRAHESWWDLIWNVQQAKRLPFTTLTPAFGPTPYLQAEPFSERPIASLEDICRWQADRQRRRFCARTDAAA